MNLKLTAILDSISPEFVLKEQTSRSMMYRYKSKRITVSWYTGGQPYEIRYEERGLIHRPHSDGPAIQRWNRDGSLCEIAYYENGGRHRPVSDGPAYQRWRGKSGGKDFYSYFEYDSEKIPKSGSKGPPEELTFCGTQIKKKIRSRLIVNLDLAALLDCVPSDFVEMDKTQNSISFSYGEKVISISWYENGQPRGISYFEGGIRHRPSADGPAIQTWHSNGQPWEVVYIENNKKHRISTEGPARTSWTRDSELMVSSYWENGEEKT